MISASFVLVSLFFVAPASSMPGLMAPSAGVEPSVVPKPPPVTLRDDDIQVWGSPRAEIVVLQISDWRCPHCERAFPVVLEAVRATPNAQLRMRSFPLSAPCNPAVERQSPPRCELAAAALCAADEGRFLDFAAKGFAEEPLVFESAPFNGAEFLACMGAPATLERVVAHSKAGVALGVIGTPSFYMRQEGVWTEAKKGTDEVVTWLRALR